jgi:hypothetical protein
MLLQQAVHIATMRSTSARTAGWSRQTSAPTCGRDASMFMPQWLRRALKPECISAQTLRARARAWRSRGHSAAVRERLGHVLAMASESQIARPSSTSTGTLPGGVDAWRLPLEAASRRRTNRSGP